MPQTPQRFPYAHWSWYQPQARNFTNYDCGLAYGKSYADYMAGGSTLELQTAINYQTGESFIQKPYGWTAYLCNAQAYEYICELPFSSFVCAPPTQPDAPPAPPPEFPSFPVFPFKAPSKAAGIITAGQTGAGSTAQTPPTQSSRQPPPSSKSVTPPASSKATQAAPQQAQLPPPPDSAPPRPRIRIQRPPPAKVRRAVVRPPPPLPPPAAKLTKAKALGPPPPEPSPPPLRIKRTSPSPPPPPMPSRRCFQLCCSHNPAFRAVAQRLCAS